MTFSSLSGERIQDERGRLGLSQAAAGELCGVSREMWGRYERGQAAMGIEVLFNFVQAGADAQYILTGRQISEAQHLSENENALLERFRQMDSTAQQVLLATSQIFAER